MGSLSNPKAWVPYVNTKDCSQGFCSLYCPQWCYIIFPPPPPSPFEFTSDSSSPKLSPLVIAIIGILASAFLLVSYYTIISKYCGNTTRREIDDVASEELEHNNHNPSFHDHEPWHVPITRGLDEALIKSITVCKYKKGFGLIEGTDCSVCLSEFEEDESLRLLPKCSHAFHVPCIDTWLKSHSNCPLCRANIFFVSASPSHLPAITTTDHHQAPQTEGTSENEAADHEQEDTERGINVAAEGEVLLMNNEIPNTPFRAFSFSDLGNLQVTETIIEIADNEGYDQQFRRSVSMDHSIQSRVSVADIIDPFGAGSSKQSQEIGKSSHRNKLMNMHCNINPVSMKRSFTSGRFSVLNRQRRLRDTIFPL